MPGSAVLWLTASTQPNSMTLLEWTGAHPYSRSIMLSVPLYLLLLTFMVRARLSFTVHRRSNGGAEDFLLDPRTCQHTIYRLLQSDFWQIHSERHCHTLINLILTKEQRSATVSFCLEVLALFGRDYHFAHRLMRRTHAPAADNPNGFTHTNVTQLMISLIETHVPGSSESQDLISVRLPWLCTETLYETSRHTKMSPHDLCRSAAAHSQSFQLTSTCSPIL